MHTVKHSWSEARGKTSKETRNSMKILVKIIVQNSHWNPCKNYCTFGCFLTLRLFCFCFLFSPLMQRRIVGCVWSDFVLV